MKPVFFFFLVLATAAFCVDLDGDGFDSDPAFGRYQDCCDSVLDGCFDPYMVNPGAFEIPNNGLLDRCVYDCDPSEGLACEATAEENLPCDFLNVKGETYVLSGPDITAPETEPAIWAMDICEFKDDDDDPSWGFYRQRNMVFALADERRNGFDIGVVGPDVAQASVLSSFGRIGPNNGRYMTVISSGIAKARYQPTPNNQPSASYVAISDVVQLPASWRNRQDPNTFPLGSICTTPSTAIDSILARFSVVQPTNMNAFSFKVMYLDREAESNFLTNPECGLYRSWFLAFKNGTVGDDIPDDGNIATTLAGHTINSFTTDIDFYTQCGVYTGNHPDNTCRKSDVRLEGTGFSFATDWIPIGTSAKPRETFELKLLTFDEADGTFDTTVLLDDFKVISEKRTTHSTPGYITTPYGYQYTGDIALVSLTPSNALGFYPRGTTEITLNFVIRNEGPEIAGDTTISFTPPFGTALKSVGGGWVQSEMFPASGDFVDNSYYKFKFGDNAPLLPKETRSGSITYTIKEKAPKDIQFRVTATTSSIDTVWGNNHLIQIVYIDKGLGL